MRRLALVAALVGVGVSLAPASAAWANDSITPMCTTSAGTQPCSTGWYTTPVLQLTWDWTAGGTPSNCNEDAYQTDTITTISCTVSWSDGFTGTQSYTLHVEVSSPTAAVAPSRLPDSNGWYNHPVAGAVSATSFSGIASCTSTTYTGPSTPSATVSAWCIDHAGKQVSVTSAPFAFDATPPSLTALATPGDQSVAINWSTGGDIAPITSIDVTRTDGTKTANVDQIYSGLRNGFDDTHLRNGMTYTYTVTARDAAGNVTVQTVRATPDARVLSPAPDAHVTSPPTLSWTAAPGASYYNVQLFRGDPAKLLSLWPARASLQLHRTWRFDGRRYRLKPGRYTWYVWPGFGKREAAHYGRMIGSGTFVIVR